MERESGARRVKGLGSRLVYPLTYGTIIFFPSLPDISSCSFDGRGSGAAFTSAMGLSAVMLLVLFAYALA